MTITIRLRGNPGQENKRRKQTLQAESRGATSFACPELLRPSWSGRVLTIRIAGTPSAPAPSED